MLIVTRSFLGNRTRKHGERFALVVTQRLPRNRSGKIGGRFVLRVTQSLRRNPSGKIGARDLRERGGPRPGKGGFNGSEPKEHVRQVRVDLANVHNLRECSA